MSALKTYWPLRFWEPVELSGPFDCLTSTVGAAVADGLAEAVAVAVALSVPFDCFTSPAALSVPFDCFTSTVAVGVVVAVLLTVVEVVLPEFELVLPEFTVVVTVATVLPEPELASLAFASRCSRRTPR